MCRLPLCDALGRREARDARRELAGEGAQSLRQQRAADPAAGGGRYGIELVAAQRDLADKAGSALRDKPPVGPSPSASSGKGRRCLLLSGS